MLEVLTSQHFLCFLCSTRWRFVLLKSEHGVLVLENGFSRLLDVLVQQIDVNMAVLFVLNLHKMCPGSISNVTSKHESCSNPVSRRFHTCWKENFGSWKPHNGPAI